MPSACTPDAKATLVRIQDPAPNTIVSIISNLKVNVMNGKKAKMLRGLAGGKAASDSGQQSYFREGHTERRKEVKNLMGEVVHVFQTATFKLNAGPRVMYKMFKKHYKQGLMRPATA